MVQVLKNKLDAQFKYDVAALTGGENIKRCFACGACSGGCLISEIDPQYDPRKLIRMVLLGMKEEVLSSPLIWLCLLCHNCSFHCTQDVKFSEIVGALRYMAVKEGYIHPSLVRFMVFQTLLPSHLRLEIFSRPMSLYHLMRFPYLLRKTRLVNLLPERLVSMETLLPPVPFQPLRMRLKTVTPPEGKLKKRVGFFLGCADNLVFTSSGAASVSVLSKNGCEVVTPKKSQCCGMPFIGYGEMEKAKKSAKHNIDVFEKTGVEAVITDCATCGSFLKGYVNLLKDDPDYCERAQVFSEKVKDISEFLVETVNLKYDFAGLNDSVTYHESCHLLWAQQVSQQPRRILGLIPGLEFVDMKNADSCCGGAGSYNLTHYEKSMSILERKMKNVIDTGANLIATGCPGCRLQLRLGVKQRNLNIQVVHPVELLDRAYKK